MRIDSKVIGVEKRGNQQRYVSPASPLMEDVGRAFEEGETKGFMKILVDRESKQILGASILGFAGDEALHCILDLMYAKEPYTVMQRAVHIHPTVSEFIPTMMGELKPLQ